MRLIDMHCDTNLKLFEAQSKSLYANSLNVDLQKLIEADSYVQFFASFFELPAVPKPYEHTLAMLNYFKTLLAEYPEFEILRSRSQLMGKKRLALLSVEEGGCMEGSILKLENLYNAGVRSITLTWNFENEIGHTNLDPENRGLKSFGYEVVEEMNRMGILIDVSHLSDKGTFDAIKHSQKPIVASHSNARALLNHSRNLNDDLIRGIASTGGAIGLNFWSELLGTSRISRIEDMIAHIEHHIKIGGEDVIAIGTDFDGINCKVEIPHIGRMGDLEKAMRAKGHHDLVIEKLFYLNAERVLKSVLME